MRIERNCIVCDKSLAHAGVSDDPNEDRFSNPPDDATVWTSVGNWGSCVFDGGEFTNTRLETYICDECLKKKANFVYHYHIKKTSEIEDVKIFDPTTDGF